MKIKLLSMFVCLAVLIMPLASCAPDLPQITVVNKIKACGVLMEGWGDSLIDAPGYNNGQGIYATWAFVDALGYDHILYNHVDNVPGYGVLTRNILQNNVIHNWGFPGQTADQITAQWMSLAKRDRGQIIWIGRNSLNDTASITRDIKAIIAAMAAVGNTKYLIVGLINSNTPSEVRGTPNSNIVKDWNLRAAIMFKGHFVDPVLAFIPNSTDQEIYDGVTPMRFTIGDGLHDNQDGALIEGRFWATFFESCPNSAQ